ncbi:Cys-tRNA(Pro) deacylase YbaK [Desulfovibrio sp. DV]|uniref:Cys-tRNA(Pro) deacylase n=1 Tax=Desulfovibrio sp. DV TaxID=1844708 RepID=UPI00094BC245|nr:Cys-tRNA(Pro) deacylase [Desulfovibrio sp. DV]OLN29462.1 Cys-tRNA(Pro) deacylase YbaK [Desulfovibrio sp. DV]
MSKTTRATQFLAKAGIAFETIQYDYESGAERIGLQAAAAIGEAPSRVLKTLMVLVDGKPACAVVPSDGELSMKRVAAAFGGKAAAMMPPAEAEKVTGYHVGGISPFGSRKKVAVAIEAAAMSEASVIINGGQRGVMVRLAPADAVRVLGAMVAPLVA